MDADKSGSSRDPEATAELSKAESASFPSYAEQVVQSIDKYLTQSRSGEERVLRLRPLSQLVSELRLQDWLRDGGMSVEGLGEFLDHYLAATTRLHHPHFLAHQVAVPHFASALADFVNGVTNNGMALFEMGPPAVALEQVMVQWMLEKIGWPDGSGVLTHGGSLANLTALLAARAQASPQAWRDGDEKLGILVPASCHYSVERAVAIMGLGTRALYHVPVDANGVLLPEQLDAVHARACSEDRRIFAVVANACATSTGLYDPLQEVGDFCRQHELWFHVDGAHGASALLSRRHRSALRGLDSADSMIWDAHKMLQTSVLCAGVLFRQSRIVDHIFQQEPEYFRDSEEPDYLNVYQRALECTKTGLGLKLFLVLAILGEERLTHDIEALYEATKRLYDLAASRRGFTCPYRPQANILCFRYGDDDPLQERIRQQLIDDGDFYISSTKLAGCAHLRVVIMNPQTTEQDLEELLLRIEGIGESKEQAIS